MTKVQNQIFYGRDHLLKPFPAALFLGLVVVISLIWFGKGLHVSGIFAVFCETESTEVISQSDALFCSSKAHLEDRTWLYWLVGGIFFGAGVTSLLRNRTCKFFIEHGSKVNAKRRLFYACSGGMLVGVGAAIAGGCTSSIGLTGASLLTVAGFAFLIAFFLGGFAARIWFGRTWQ
ncbi:MAG: hypothetical protein A2622_08560 [Bdellovibrionales bacterium RIFCSPHIGHO2_01_FULL_40_29]|nr:MAG: hypothetical protein A2622_08560 [Bdellovibrionales bacterium RIFCSPHIGHO2_01_FULL_40_29]OFZ35540.1 MAG: hypothetical protein A3D17_07795 [Bdellovibrionales bacterium RIFCSPHIGHO2_02_FULL_40_15]